MSVDILQILVCSFYNLYENKCQLKLEFSIHTVWHRVIHPQMNAYIIMYDETLKDVMLSSSCLRIYITYVCIYLCM